MSKEILKKWLIGEYVSPQEFKDSVQEAVKRIGILEKIYKADVEKLYVTTILLKSAKR